MNYLLFGLEILLIVMGIAVVPARSKLRICRSRVIYNGRAESKALRS
jgi:P pilus assembly chaperone PapD